MNKFHVFSVMCVLIAVVFFFLGIESGEVETGVFLVFPFLIGSGLYAFLGVLFLFLAMIFFMVGFTRIHRDERAEFDDEQEINLYYPSFE